MFFVNGPFDFFVFDLRDFWGRHSRHDIERVWHHRHRLPGFVRQQEVCHEEFPAGRGEVERRAGAGLDPAGVDAGGAQEALDDGHVAALRGVVQGSPSLGVGQVDVDIRAAVELQYAVQWLIKNHRSGVHPFHGFISLPQ